jgi:hypothetical protein
MQYEPLYPERSSRREPRVAAPLTPLLHSTPLLPIASALFLAPSGAEGCTMERRNPCVFTRFRTLSIATGVVLVSLTKILMQELGALPIPVHPVCPGLRRKRALQAHGMHSLFALCALSTKSVSELLCSQQDPHSFLKQPGVYVFATKFPPFATLPVPFGEPHADTRRRLETSLRIHRFRKPAQTHARSRSLRPRLRPQIRR